MGHAFAKTKERMDKAREADVQKSSCEACSCETDTGWSGSGDGWGFSVGLDGACAFAYVAFVYALLAFGATFAVAVVAFDGAIASAGGTVLHDERRWLALVQNRACLRVMMGNVVGAAQEPVVVVVVVEVKQR